MTVYAQLISRHTADIVNSDTGEVLFTTISVTRRLCDAEVRWLRKGCRRLRLVAADEVLDAAVAWATRRRLFLTEVRVWERPWVI